MSYESTLNCIYLIYKYMLESSEEKGKWERHRTRKYQWKCAVWLFFVRLWRNLKNVAATTATTKFSALTLKQLKVFAVRTWGSYKAFSHVLQLISTIFQKNKKFPHFLQLGSEELRKLHVLERRPQVNTVTNTKGCGSSLLVFFIMHYILIKNRLQSYS